MIPTIRLHSQQLINPVFNNPKDLVSWMGGIQAQDYTMSKWAIGIRLKAGNLQTVNEALAKGDILRIHVMRPTWHYVAAEDIRWMLKLSSRRIITANDSFAKSRGQDISVDIYNKANRLLEKALAGHNHLTKQEIDNVFKEGGLETNERLSNRFLIHAEAEGLICSGADKNNKILISNEINLFLFFLSIVKYIAINITTVIITNHIIIWCESPVCGLTLLPLYTYFNSYDFS